MKNDSPWLPNNMPGDSSFDTNHDGKLSGNETFNRDNYWNTEGKDYLSNETKNNYNKAYGRSMSGDGGSIASIIGVVIILGALYAFVKISEIIELNPRTALFLLVATVIFYTVIHFIFAAGIKSVKSAVGYAVSMVAFGAFLFLFSYIVRYGISGAFQLLGNLFTHSLDIDEFMLYNDNFRFLQFSDKSLYTIYVSLRFNAIIFSAGGIITAIKKH